jgi:hypothetical protein
MDFFGDGVMVISPLSVDKILAICFDDVGISEIR